MDHNYAFNIVSVRQEVWLLNRGRYPVQVPVKVPLIMIENFLVFLSSCNKCRHSTLKQSMYASSQVLFVHRP